MVYYMFFEVDGACRRNGRPEPLAAAAVVRSMKYNNFRHWTEALPDYPTPTNQRAELTAIILALKVAWKQFQCLNPNPYIDVTIKSDSQYAVNCMNVWMKKWTRNGWRNSSGRSVANADLLQEALDLDIDLKVEGDVRYEWICREENEHADQLCNEKLDEMEEEDW